MRASKKKMYESTDVIIQEMANQFFKDNRETNKEKIDHFEIKENIENIELEENLDLLLEYLMMKKKVLPQI